MTSRVRGLHHVTAIASDPQTALDFYGGVLGLRLVKRTVNYDDPSAYHFYFGDERGSPGTLLTFFSWPHVRSGKPGPGQIGSVALSIPRPSLGFWVERLSALQVEVVGSTTRTGGTALGFKDPDGLQLDLVGSDVAAERPGRAVPGIPVEHSIRGLHSVTLLEHDTERSAEFLVETLGLCPSFEDGARSRLSAGMGGPGELVEVRPAPLSGRGLMGAGAVHHVAFRVPDDRTQVTLRGVLSHRGARPTVVIDRQYFRSVYFREPGGALFELATDGPGFLVDEPVETLGEQLSLPGWLEPNRPVIEEALPRVRMPRPAVA